ncbi:MAG: hypothetical protein ABIV06_11245 [Thermoanaerobaculia bacterium]
MAIEYAGGTPFRPSVLDARRTLFDGVHGPLGLKLTQSRAFPGGKVSPGYAPARAGALG